MWATATEEERFPKEGGEAGSAGAPPAHAPGWRPLPAQTGPPAPQGGPRPLLGPQVIPQAATSQSLSCRGVQATPGPVCTVPATPLSGGQLGVEWVGGRKGVHVPPRSGNAFPEGLGLLRRGPVRSGHPRIILYPASCWIEFRRGDGLCRNPRRLRTETPRPR